MTGGSSGIGFEISRQLGALCCHGAEAPPCPSSHGLRGRPGAGLHGAKLVLMGRRKEALDDASSSLSAEGVTVLTVQVGCSA